MHSTVGWYWIVPVGGRFWLGMLGTIVAIGIGVGILFLIIGAAFIAWGILGALIFFGGIAMLIAWYSDRKRQAQYDES